MSTDHEPTIMVATKQYNTFQLCCSIVPADDSYSIHDVFNKVVLYIVDWFRQRIGNDEETVSQIACYPAPEGFKDYELADLPEIRISETFRVNSLYLPERSNWSFRTDEPDNYAEYEGQESAGIVKGRRFITNIAVHEGKACVTLSYKSACHEPRENTAECEVFRPAFLKTICRDINLTVKELPDSDSLYDLLTEKCISVDSNSFSNQLATTLILNRARQLPVLLITGDSLDREEQNSVAQRLIGFCHVFYVVDKQFNRLFKARLENHDVEPGDIVLYGKGEEYEVIDAGEGDSAANRIVSVIRRYPVRKNIDYRSTLFYRDAKAARYEVINSNDPTELIAQVEQQRDLIESLNQKMNEMQADTEDLQEQLRSMTSSLKTSEELADSLHEMVNNAEASRAKITHKNASLQREASACKELLRTVMGFPSKREDVGKWIRNNYSKQLILLERAENNLIRYDKPVNMKVLCSAIVYLNAYVLFSRGQITDSELEFFKIEKPWDIALCGSKNIERFSEYRIDLSEYGVKEKTDYLTFHLKSGNRTDNLLRIYFSINNELDRIVIGHLPDHLPIVSRVH